MTAQFGSGQMQLLIVMIVYLGLLIAWGIYQGLKVKSSSDYSIGGRKIKGWIAALSERATGESSWALLGLPGAAYAAGISEIWTAIGCVLGVILSWSLLAWRLQKEAAKYDVKTFTDYIAKKHSDFSLPLRILSSSVIVFFFFFYIGAQLLGGGKTLNTMFGLNQNWGMIITMVIIVPYTFIGGLRSVMYTDVVQSIVMITTLIVTPIVGIWYISHHPEVFATSIPAALEQAGDKYTSLTKGLKGLSAGLFIGGGLAWVLGYFGGQPQITTRFMAIRSEKEARQARNISIIWTLIAYVGALSIGWIGIAIFGPHTLQDQEFVMPKVLMTLFHPVVAGILITGAVAAMISTADSLLVLSSTELAENILNLKEKDERKKLSVSRFATGLIAIFALASVYIVPSKLIFQIVSFVWAGIGDTFSVVILFSLLAKKYNGKAAFTTILVGIVFTIVWIATGMEEILTTRYMTFIVAAITALISMYVFDEKQVVLQKK